MRISCLHADADSIAEFEDAAPPHVALVHFISSPVLADSPAALMVETNMMVTRAARGSDAVLVTCPQLSRVTHPPALNFLDLLVTAIGRMKGPVEGVSIAGDSPSAMVQAVERAGASVHMVTPPEDDHGMSFSEYLETSAAREIILLSRQLIHPPDFRIHSAAALALSAMADTNLVQ